MMASVGDDPPNMDTSTSTSTSFVVLKSQSRAKRTILELDSSIEKQVDSNSMQEGTNLPAPILVRQAWEGKLVQSDRIKLETQIEAHCQGININRVKFTEAGNILFYLKTQQDVEQLLEQKDLFPNCTWVDLATSAPKSYLLVVRGISKDNILRYNNDSLTRQGVIEVREMKSVKSGKQMNLTKLFFNSKEDRDRILAEKYIRIGYSRYEVEEFGSTPKQCHKCKMFGHLALNCLSSATLCSKCGGEHDSDSCEGSLKCVNCGGGHSAYWRGCDAYQQVRSDRLNTNQKASTRPPTTFHRNYSAAVNQPAPNADLFAHIDSTIKTSIEQHINSTIKATLEQQFALQLEPFITRLSAAEEQITSLNKDLSDMRELFGPKVKAVLNENNVNCALFVLELFKLLSPPQSRKERTTVGIITELFSSHSLGSLDSKLVENRINVFLAPLIHTTKVQQQHPQVSSVSNPSNNLSGVNTTAVVNQSQIRTKLTGNGGGSGRNNG